MNLPSIESILENSPESIVLNYGKQSHCYRDFKDILSGEILSNKSEFHIYNLCFESQELNFLYQSFFLQKKIVFCTHLVKEHRDLLRSSGLKVKDLNEKEVDTLSNHYGLAELEEPQFTPALDGISYLITSSGSTGAAKLSKIPLGSIVKFNSNISEYFTSLEIKKVLNCFSANFDPFIGINLLSCAKGAELHFCASNDLIRFWEKLDSEEIDCVAIVPSLLRFASKLSDKTFPNLKNIFFTGEKISKDVLEIVKKRFPSTKVYNLYGPVENTIWSSVSQVNLSAGPSKISIGKPMDGVIYTIEEESELVISGAQLHSSYFGEEEKNKFHTKDIASLRSDGEYFIHSRLNRKEKVLGVFVDLDTIELEFSQMFATDAISFVDQGKVSFIISKKISANWKSQFRSKSVSQEGIGEVYSVSAFSLGATGKLDRSLTIKEVQNDQDS